MTTNRMKGTGPCALVAAILVLAGCPGEQKPSTGLIAKGNPAALKVDPPNRPRATPSPNPLPTLSPQTPATPGPANPGPVPTPVIPTIPLPTATPVPIATSQPSTGGGSSGGSSGGGVASIPSLIGKVKLVSQLLSDSGSSIIANNGSSIIANNGSGVISNNGGSLLSDSGSSIISDAGTSYRILGVSTTNRALTNAFVYLTNRDEKYWLDANGKVLATTVNNAGDATFTTFPTDKDVIVNAVANGNLRLTGFAIPTSAGATLDVDLGSTLATEFLRADAYRENKSLKAYDFNKVQEVAALTRSAIGTGDITSIRTVRDLDAKNTPVGVTAKDITVGVFDLRADRTADLRNQYVVSFSAAAFGNTVLRQISDAWKALTGVRQTAVTSLLGSGKQPTVVTDAVNQFREVGFATGDQRGTTPATPPEQIPLGDNNGLAVAARGDVFVACYNPSIGGSGHIRWIHPDGKINTIWLPTYAIGVPTGLCVEREPTNDLANPGTLLVADASAGKVFRVYLIDEAIPNSTVYPGIGFNGTDVERHFMEIVAGENVWSYDPTDPYVGFLSQAHPHAIDNSRAFYDANLTPDTNGASGPLLSRWRFADEGPRTYGSGTAVPLPGRYSHLDQPTDVEVDELGNIYIADKANHRIRFIPSVTGLNAEGDKNFYEYKTPTLNADQEIDRLNGKPEMKAGAIYTIAGNPDWDTNNTPVGTSRWFGDYFGDGGPAQLAKLDQPYALAFNKLDKCLYVADIDNMRIRKIDRATGLISTVAGSPPGAQRNNGLGDFDFTPGYSGDGGPATAAQLAAPRGIAFDAKGRLYIADTVNGLIRMVDTNGTISTVAGRYHPIGGVPTDNATDGDALHHVDLYDTEKIDVDAQGNVVLVDHRHGRVRKLWRQWD